MVFFACVVFLFRTWAACEEDWPQHGPEHPLGAQGEVLGQRWEEEARAPAAGAGNGDFYVGKTKAGNVRKFKTPAKVHRQGIKRWWLENKMKISFGVELKVVGRGSKVFLMSLHGFLKV